MVCWYRDPFSRHVLKDQLADVHQLRIDAEQRGWDSEVERHQRVIDSLEGHPRRIDNTTPSKEVS